MGQHASHVLAARIASGVPFSARFLSRLSESGVVPIDRADGALFLEGIVQLYLAPDAQNVTVRKERLVFTGRARAPRAAGCSPPAAHAADLCRPRPEAVQDVSLLGGPGRLVVAAGIGAQGMGPPLGSLPNAPAEDEDGQDCHWEEGPSRRILSVAY
jgi:hypothetical protein